MSVGLGIVGLGRWAHAHADAAGRTESVHLTSCFSRDSDRRAAFASEYGLSHTADSYEVMLADPEVEAVVLATPNDLHVSMALAAIEAGKPVLIDKPVSVDLRSGLQLLRVVTASHAQVGIAQHPRRLAGLRTAKRWLESGDAGVPRLADANFSNSRGAHLKPDAWHRNVEGSDAGVLIQVGIHQVDNVLWLLGPPVAVNARLGHQTLGHLADSAVVVIQHASGAVSTVTSSWTTPGLFRLELQATGGNLRYRLDHRFWTSGDVDDHGSIVLDQDDQTGRSLDMVKGDPLSEQLTELAAATRRPGAMEVDVAAGLRAVTVVLAAVRSSERAGAEVGVADMLVEAGATADEVTLLTAGAADQAI